MNIRGLIGLIGVCLVGGACATGGSGGGSDAGIGGSGHILTGSGTTEPGEACTETEECVPGSVCFNEFCVGQGALRISLGFEVDTDFDLHVDTPLGSEIYYGSTTADGGTLDVDQCVSSCGSGSHVENVVFYESAPGGTYTVRVENFNGRAGGAFTIEVAGAATQTFNGSLPATAGAEQEFTFTIAGGNNNNNGSGGTGNNGSGGTGNSAGGSGSASNGGSSGEVDCEASCPSEFPNDIQLDSFCRMACCYTLSGTPDNAATTCTAGESLGTSSCDYCN